MIGNGPAGFGRGASEKDQTLGTSPASYLTSSLGNIPPSEHEQRYAAALAAHPEALLFSNGSVTLNAAGVYDPFGVVSDLR